MSVLQPEQPSGLVGRGPKSPGSFNCGVFLTMIQNEVNILTYKMKGRIKKVNVAHTFFLKCSEASLSAPVISDF